MEDGSIVLVVSFLWLQFGLFPGVGRSMEVYLRIETIPILCAVVVSLQYFVGVPAPSILEGVVGCEATALGEVLGGLGELIGGPEDWIRLSSGILEGILRCGSPCRLVPRRMRSL